MEENKSILHELYVFSEWKPEPEYIQKPDNILPENISALWRWLKFFGPKKSLIDSITAYKERQQKWHIALGDEGKVIAVLTDNILEIRTKRSDYATIAARTTVTRDAYPQWRKLVWSPDCSFLAMAYGNGVVSFFDLTASNLFNIPADCNRPGGLECTDNTHAVADIIFMPLRVKDNKWNWEVLVVTYDGRLRGYLVSATDGCKLHHSFRFPGGVGALAHCAPHDTLYVCGLPRALKDPSSAISAGITAWRILNEDPFYKLSVVSDQLEMQNASERFQLYIPFVSAKNLAFIVQMVISPDNRRLVCLHCNGDVSVWLLPLLRLARRWGLAAQPDHGLRSPLGGDGRAAAADPARCHAADVHWWSGEEIILSRFSGAVSVCHIDNMVNILGKKPEFFQGAPRVTAAHHGTFMVLECESNVLPAKKSRSVESTEVVEAEVAEDSTLALAKELLKSVLFVITDMEAFQPRPRRVTVVSRVYRLLGVRSTTPRELFSRKIESGHYADALSLAETFNLDSDLVYQQQWRKNPVSTDAIQKYLSKVSKKIWAVHQCVDRLPETAPAAAELLQFGLALTNEEILKEINKDREEKVTSPEDIVLSDLNAYSSELLRCRHVMLFYRDRMALYQAILRCEKSTYVKDEYDRLRSNSLVHSSIEIAKEGRIEALTCLWPHIKTIGMQLAVLESLPETINPLDYQHLLPIKEALMWFEKKSPVKIVPSEFDNDWCRKEIFRSIWSSNWSEDSTPDSEYGSPPDDIAKWYEKRAREIEEISGLVSHALTLATLAAVGGGVRGLDDLMFHLLTLDTLVYDLNVEGVTLAQLEKLSSLETCKLLMKTSTPATFVSDLKQYVIPFLKRYENLSKRTDACLNGLIEYLEDISSKDLSSILLVLQSPSEFELDVRTHLDLAERCLFAYTEYDQLDKACDLLDTILKESDGSISPSELVRRVKQLERLVTASSLVNWRGVGVAPRDLRDLYRDHDRAHKLLLRVARADLKVYREEKWTPQEWEKLLKDLLELQSTLFTCVSKEEVYEIYASSVLTCGSASSIPLAASVLTCATDDTRLVGRARSVHLAAASAREYFNSAVDLRDPMLQLAKITLSLIQYEDAEIQNELDLIASLEIIDAFNVDLLPIQVRLCEDRLTIIEKCLKADPNAFLASHRLLKLAKLLRVAGDDDQAREAQVLQLVASHALAAAESGGAGADGGASAVAAARRLAALRAAGAAPLLAAAARAARAPADRAARRHLYAAAAASCAPADLEGILRDRLSLELEGLQQMGAAARDQRLAERLAERCPSADDEFADAVTTPVIEKKDLVAPAQSDKKTSLLNYLLDSFQNKGPGSDQKPQADPDALYSPEFYRSLYPGHETWEGGYSYSGFSAEGAPAAAAAAPAALLWYYGQSCLEDPPGAHMESEVVQKCADELLNKDTALSVACLLRGPAPPRRHPRAAVSAALYAAVLARAAPALRDHVYLAAPTELVRLSLESPPSDEPLEVVRGCLRQLAGCGEAAAARALGVPASAPLFAADPHYRREIVLRLARSPGAEHLELACSLATKYGMDALEAWLQHAGGDPGLAHLTAATLPPVDASTYARVRDGLWPQISGRNHNALINFFTVLKSIDEKPALWGLTAAEHIKLLKKVKAASNELDYKILLEPPPPEQFSAQLLALMRPESVGLLTKLLRGLPPACRLPVPVTALYTMWLTTYFFSDPSDGSSASNKKWMQRYRQCASYFNKLAKKELMRFLADACFSDQALRRVPAGTRNLMLMQAVDYCQQEQENDFKYTKDEMSWTQVGQELTRWARFLENFHSTTIQAVVDHSGIPRDEIWPEIERSHGDLEAIVPWLSRLVLAGLPPAALGTLLQCLHVPAAAPDVLRRAAADCPADQVQTLVTRLTQYHKEGVKLPEDLLEEVMQRASDAGLPPHRQIGLLALSQRTQPADAGDLATVARYTADLVRTEWRGEDCAQGLSDEKLFTEEGRREVFNQLLERADRWARRKALVDVLDCWPVDIDSEARSLQCRYVRALLAAREQREQRESVALVKLLLRRRALGDEEVEWATADASGAAAAGALWAALLGRRDAAGDHVVSLAHRLRESLATLEIEDDLIKELLDSGLFIKLVSTALYSPMINHIIGGQSSGEPASCTVQWAVAELMKAGHTAEAGQLQLLSMGVPAAMRAFTQSVLYCRNIFKK